MARNEKKWSGAKKNGWEGKKMNGNEKKWPGPGKNALYREKMVRNKKKVSRGQVLNAFDGKFTTVNVFIVCGCAQQFRIHILPN